MAPFVRIVVAAALALGCLPEDTRPEPAKVLVEVALPDELSVSEPGPERRRIEFESDGWTVSVDRLYVSLGEVEVLADAACSEYADAPHFRILDLAQEVPQRLGQVWGLGRCQFDYTVEVPPPDVVLGAGVTEAEGTFMRTARVPVSTPDGPATASGMALWLRGRASRGERTVSFDWGFAERLQWTQCRRSIDGGAEPGVPLRSGETMAVTLTLDPRKLFEFEGTPLIPLVADAERQGNADGAVTVSELTRVDAPGSAQPLAEVLRTGEELAVRNRGDPGAAPPALAVAPGGATAGADALAAPRISPHPGRGVRARRGAPASATGHRGAFGKEARGVHPGHPMAAFSRGDCGAAGHLFTRFERRHPKSAHREDVLFLRALCRAKRGDPAGARALAEEYLRRYPRGFRVPEATRLAGSSVPSNSGGSNAPE